MTPAVSFGISASDQLRSLEAFLAQTRSLLLRFEQASPRLFESRSSRKLIGAILRETLDPLLILRRLLLHAPGQRPADLRGEWIEREIVRQAEELPVVDGRKVVPSDLSRAEMVLIDPAEALAIHKERHYLGSPREAGVHLGLRDSLGGGLLSLITISPLDLPHLGSVVPEPGRTAMLTRLYVFPGAPRNSATRTIRKAIDWLRRETPEILALMTYFNPNLGFAGSVYRAANWQLLAQEQKKRYLYLDGRYVTDRLMIGLHGTADFSILASKLGGLTRSQREILPLDILGFHFKRDLRRPAPKIAVLPPPADRVGS